ncbi:hypothetical protein QFZ63_004662 [Streptomyces sp. B3I7]|uniref:hypothetical protein n=1 Tax=Streptomyces sp. B3I7 TaxID=3042269 RepID=UPI00277DFFFB|nr:hypothetical protein [Streptomyces sp. B3I7]MDQ0812948.1 hypothetical protein [Streptomyces sp. B3I7]
MSSDSGKWEWKHHLVLAAWITGGCGVVAAVLYNPDSIPDLVDRVRGNVPSKVTYTLDYHDVGTVKQPTTTVKAVLTDDVEYIKGSTYYYDVGGKTWRLVEGDSIVTKGLDLHGDTKVRFSAHVSHTKHYVCGPDGVSISLDAKTTKGAEKKDDQARSSLHITTKCES